MSVEYSLSLTATHRTIARDFLQLTDRFHLIFETQAQECAQLWYF